MSERWPAEFAGGADPVALVERILAESTVTHHPAYLGHQLAAPLPTAALTTLVTAVVNGSGAIYELSQSGTACEAALARYLAGRLGMPATAGGMIVHGGTIATLTALLAARQAKAGFDVWRDGAHAGPPLALLTSDQAHYSTARAAQIMGFGAAGAISVESDERCRMRPEALAAEIAAARARGQRPDRGGRDRGHHAHGRVRPARGDRRHLRRRGAVAARRRRARRIGRAEPAAGSAAGRHRARGFGRVGSPQDASVPGARLVTRVRARARRIRRVRPAGRVSLPQPATRAPRTWARARWSARDRSSPWSPTSGFATVGAEGLRTHVERLWELGRELADAGARERRLRARARARVQHRLLPPPLRAGRRFRRAPGAHQAQRSTPAGLLRRADAAARLPPGCAARS